MRQEQAEFRKGMSCRDHIFTLRQILEQSKEWNSTVYVNFIDFEKAFDSIQRESLWRILRHYCILSKLVNIIRLSYTDFCSQLINGNLLSDPFNINTGVKQWCILSPFLFIIGIDWIMKNMEQSGRRGIQWTFTSMLEDLDFADDICLLSHRHIDIQAKTRDLATTAEKIGLKINIPKTKLMRMNTKSNESIILHGDKVTEIDDFTYLGLR
ncbi:uncharacterized protein LOC121368594 [Gigantopelta aegis]|uniref:uncharacterized protein LOC121368594 n=1 Tax=Gigantopelta aegis TaxID=1735272 RepID=UPI001B887CA9|nr:uncharacterized protein LOC121368594 [Gigantopelta aegis]